MIRALRHKIINLMTQQLKRTTPAHEDEISSTIVKKFKPETTSVLPQSTSFGISEEEVGILKFINNSTVGFSGLLKTLHCDFQVFEINLNDNVIHLIDEGIDVGKTNREKKIEAAKEKQNQEEKPTTQVEESNQELKKFELSSENKEELLKYITSDELNEIEELFNNGNNMETKTSFDVKETRGKLHQLFRESFQNKLETVTTPTNTFKIAIAKNKGGGQRRGNNQSNQESMHHVDENGVINYGAGPFKPFLHFTVFKQNRDTMDVSNNIAKMLKIQPKNINYSGTKDRRGVTCQRFSINKGKVLRVNALNKLKNSNFKLGEFKYEDQPLKLGDLNGNEFLITLKDVKIASGDNSTNNIREVVDQCFKSFNEKGFINYFGMQRFGSFSVATHELGKAILQENWEKAVELLLSEQEICSPGTIEMRKIWKETKNPKDALSKLQRHFVAENSILKVLSNEPQDENKNFKSHSYLKALLAIPKNLRMMYVHSYQSYVWNLVASKRIELFGYEIQEGDLVLNNEEEGTKSLKDDDEFEEDIANFEPIPVKAVTKEDIAEGKYSIFDVILPSPGYKITYPENEKLQNVYIDTMSLDNLDPFKLIRKNKEFSLTGAYRNLISKPKDISYKIIEYKNDQTPLVRTDLEILDILKSKGINSTTDSELNLKNFEKEAKISRFIEQDLNNGNDDEEIKLAVILQMKLGVSSYATMALREFMRLDTSRYAHMK
ncbi:PUS7 [Candida pseudojiufengensis]|uniref:PUS7 n=1 Tax=Candida pseudojiufengensis TaxID=497109 RepID=UPI002224449C|nr:PUS7 [Candida pseudojiufengensis]KAI5965355.1 PUS7 [Candida pseudojiufengensis]